MRKRKNEKNEAVKIRRTIIDGRSVSIQFFINHAWFMIFFVTAVLALIGLRYNTQTKMVRIGQLKRELEQSENSKIEQKSRYMSLIRESEMQRIIERQHLDLQFCEQPPYEIIKTSEDKR